MEYFADEKEKYRCNQVPGKYSREGFLWFFENE
jgi:hypothetical protein